MARGKKKEPVRSPEERLQAALVPDWEQPYKVPENWCWTRMENIAQWGSGGTPSRKISEYYNGNIPWVKTGELNNDYIFETEEHITQNAILHSSAKLFPVNTVVIAMYGATIGKVGILGVEATTNQACACGVPNSLVNYKYLFYYAISQKDNFINKGKGGAQPNISQEIIKSHEFPLPPLLEQQRIVGRIESLFTKLDEAKQKAQDVLDSFETRKAAILHKAFTGELTVQWRKEHGVGMESWEKTILKNVCKVNPKKIDTNGLPDNLEVSFFPMASLSEINGEIIEPQIKLLKDVKSGFTNFSEGDVVFAKITPCMENGKSAVIGKLVNDIGYGTTEFYVLRCNEKLYNRYLHHIVRDITFRREAKYVMTGAVGQQRVPKSFIENYPLYLPSVPEQTEIVRILDNILSKEKQAKEAAEKVLEQINLTKKAILTRAFRGELGTNDPSEKGAVHLLQKITSELSLNKGSSKKKPNSKPRISIEIQKQLSTSIQEKVYRFILENPHCKIEQIFGIGKDAFECIEALWELEKKDLIRQDMRDNTLTVVV